LKIRIPKIDGEDFAACNPDPEGIFSVRNAYNSALMNRSNTSDNGSSTNPNGERKLWDLIWKANVPPKIRVFGWKLASRSLALQTNRCKRIKNALDTCQVCGREPECEFHVVNILPKSYHPRLGLDHPRQQR
jgi:hypothetical protein